MGRKESLIELLSNERLQEMLESLNWELVEYENSYAELADLKEIREKSELLTLLIVNLFHIKRLKFNDYTYTFDGKRVKRTGPKIQRKLIRNLPYKLTQILTSGRLTGHTPT
jgi:hypothetical protein